MNNSKLLNVINIATNLARLTVTFNSHIEEYNDNKYITIRHSDFERICELIKDVNEYFINSIIEPNQDQNKE